MKPHRKSIAILGASLIVFTASAYAADIVKENNTNALNLGTSWVGGIVPGTGDVAVWNNTLIAGNSSALSADVSWGGIKVTNVGGTQHNGSGTNSVQITGSGSQITLGSLGIDLSSATQATQVQSKILLGGNQSWTVTNANTNGNPFGGSFSEDLYFNAQTAGTAMNFGGSTVSTSGTGSIAITSGYTLSNGALSVDNAGGLLIQSGASRTTTVNSNLSLNVASGRILMFKANSGSGGVAVNSAAPVSLSGGILKIESSNTTQINQSGKLTMGGISTLDNTYGNTSANSRLQLSGGIEVTGTATWKESNTSATATIFNSALTGGGTLNFQNTSTTRRADWSGDNSGFTGTVNINGASGNRNLRLTSATAGSASGTWVPSAGNILEVDGVAVNFGTLNGAGTVTNSHATNTATISVASGNFNGMISNGVPINGMALIKTGVGTLALTGANSYTGPTDIQSGTLTTTTAETGSGAVSVSDTATLGVTQLNNGDTFNVSTLSMGTTGGATLELTPAAAPSAALVTAGTFTVNGPTILRVKGLPISGTTLVSYSTLGGSSGFSGLNLAMPFRINGILNDTGSAITLTGVQDETPKWRNGDGVWDINTSGNWKTSSTSTTTNYLQGGPGLTDSVIFDDSASGTSPITVTLNSTVSPVAITVTGNKAYTISGSGEIAGSTGIIKNGSAALTLATANTFSGGVLLNEGTLNVNHGSALGSGTLTIADGTTLGNTSGSPLTASPSVSSVWNGSFTFIGSNDLNLGGPVTLTTSPTVTVNAGNLSVGGLSGPGHGFSKEGPGTLTIGAGSYNGSTFVNAGTLRAGAASAFNSTGWLLLSDVVGVNLDLNGFNQTINSLDGGGTTGGNILLGGGVLTTSSSGTIGALSGAGGLVKNGVTTFNIVGLTNSYTGTTTINGGVLDVGNVDNFLASSGVLTMSGGAVLQGSGSISRIPGTGNTVVSQSGGFAACGGQLDVDLGTFFNFSNGGFSFGGNFVLGSASADSKVRVTSSIGINNNGFRRTITVPLGAGGDSAELAGSITPGSAGGVSGIQKDGGGLLILSAANTYIGDTLVNDGSLTLATTGQLLFRPTTNGTSNRILDASPAVSPAPLNVVTLDGAFAIDLSSANTTAGNSWVLVNMASVAATHSSTFSVIGFSDADLDDVWTRNDGINLWSYSEATGTLSVAPSPITGFALWITGSFNNGTLATADQGPNDDPDDDGISNLVEYAIAGQDPTIAGGSVGTQIGNTVTFSKRQPLAVDLTYAIEQSTDLGLLDSWDEVSPSINDGSSISYTLPGGPTKDFMRLKVTQNP